MNQINEYPAPVFRSSIYDSHLELIEQIDNCNTFIGVIQFIIFSRKRLFMGSFRWNLPWKVSSHEWWVIVNWRNVAVLYSSALSNPIAWFDGIRYHVPSFDLEHFDIDIPKKFFIYKWLSPVRYVVGQHRLSSTQPHVPITRMRTWYLIRYNSNSDPW